MEERGEGGFYYKAFILRLKSPPVHNFLKMWVAVHICNRQRPTGQTVKGTGHIYIVPFELIHMCDHMLG